MTDVKCDEKYCKHNKDRKCTKKKIYLYIGTDVELHCAELGIA